MAWFETTSLLAQTWEHISQLDPAETNVLEKIIRPFLVYGALVILLRAFGKRELAQLNPFDLVVLLSLSNTVQNAIIGEDNSVTGGLIGAVALLSVNYVVAWLKFRSPRLESVIEGKPLTLIADGKIIEGAARRELLTEEDLQVVAHREGFKELQHVESCILDPNGSFLVEGETHEERQRDEILRRLTDLQSEMAQIKQTLASRKL